MLVRSCSNEPWAGVSHESHSQTVEDTDSVSIHQIPTEKDHDASPATEESMNARIERLGRERPPTFSSLWAELIFCFSILMSQILTEFFVSGFALILPTLITDLHIPQASSVWPATAFSLVIASTLLVFGRLGDMYGGYYLYLGGLTWLTIWTIIAGFSINPLMLTFCRALQGLGAAAFLPASIMLIGSVYRPGPRKNLVFAVYGACAVIGFFTGIFVAGIVGQFLRWGFYFWIGGILSFITLVTAIFSIPNDYLARRRNNIKMDYAGSITIVSGLVLVVFSITESAHAPQGWRTPYIPIIFVLGILLLIIAANIEARMASMPLLPADLFTTDKRMAPLMIALMLLYGTCGILLLYGTQYFQNIMGAEPLQIVAWYTPMAVGGLFLSLFEGFFLHLIPGRILLIISGIGALGAQLLLALVPVGGNYWAFIFPAMVMGTIGIDLAYTLMTVFVTTLFPGRRQGLAGGVINSVLQLGIAFILGFSDIIQSKTVEGGHGAAAEVLDEEGEMMRLRTSYKNVFWFGVAIAGVSLVMLAVWGDVGVAKSDLTADEKEELKREATRESEGVRSRSRSRA